MRAWRQITRTSCRTARALRSRRCRRRCSAPSGSRRRCAMRAARPFRGSTSSATTCCRWRWAGTRSATSSSCIGQALADGATDVITVGRQQSNHCRLTAAACAKAGLRAHLVLTGDAAGALTGNLLLDELLGARMYFTGSDERSLRQAWVDVSAPMVARLRRASVRDPRRRLRRARRRSGMRCSRRRSCEQMRRRSASSPPRSCWRRRRAARRRGCSRACGSWGATRRHGFAVHKAAGEVRA